MKFLAAYFITFLFIAFCSCSQSDNDIRIQKTIDLDEKSAQLVESTNEFGLDLFRHIYASEKKCDNTMVSPLSVSLALAMTYNGANGETQSAMEKTLRIYGLTPEGINQSYSSLVAALKSIDPKVLLEIANAIYYREGFQVENNFISTNKNHYEAEIEALDFGAPQAKETINDWVADKTNNKIDNIIDHINADQVMFLLNAIYFKGIWKNEFDDDDTKDLPFYTDNNNSVMVPSMQKTDVVPYISNSLFSAVKFPYGAGNYNMFVFLPNEENTVQDIIDKLEQNNWSNWMDSFGDNVNADIQLPRLKYEYEIKLNDVLSNMGMGIAFTGDANFTGINKAGNLKIDYVKHKTFIEVNEKGTEAAAVTVVAIELTSVGPSQNIPFIVNRPFFYAITEKDTGAILFMGTVKNPAQEG